VEGSGSVEGTFLRVEVSPHWGFGTALYSGTKTRPPLIAPPPTTLIGALAYPISRLLGRPENPIGGRWLLYELASTLHGVYARLDLPLIAYGEITRLKFYKKREKEVYTDAPSYVRVYSHPSGTVTLLYIFDEQKAKLIFGGDWQRLVVCAAVGIKRLGDRESLVSVKSVEYGKAKLELHDRVETSYYAPLLPGVKYFSQRNFVTVVVVDWRRASSPDYSASRRTIMIVPYDPGSLSSAPVEARAADGAKVKAWRVEGRGGAVEYAVAWT